MYNFLKLRPTRIRDFIMKKFKRFIFSAFIFLLLTSCSVMQSPPSQQEEPTTKTTIKIDYMESSTQNLEPQNMIMTSPMIADLKVIGDQITYTETEAFKDIEVTQWVINNAISNFKLLYVKRLTSIKRT